MHQSFEKRSGRRDEDLTFARPPSFFLEKGGTFFEKRSYLEVLGAYLLALTSLYTL